MFLRDFDEDRTIGVDIDPGTIGLFRKTGMKCELQKAAPSPPLEIMAEFVRVNAESTKKSVTPVSPACTNGRHQAEISSPGFGINAM